MKKIPTLLVRDPDDRAHVLPEVTPGCEWVLDREGVATRKYDGTCVARDDDGRWWARREVKASKPVPAGFMAVEHDDVTGKTVGWEPIEQSPFHRYWQEAYQRFGTRRDAGTYELTGPKINGNHEQLTTHQLVLHAAVEQAWILDGRTIDGITTAVASYAARHGWEGIVWHHPDGRMAKLKSRDLKEPKTA